MDIEIKNNFNAKNMTSFKVSGLIKTAYFPKDVDELVFLLNNIEKPLVLGNCSNVLISSYGYDGNVIFTSNCNKYEINKNNVYAECGVKGPLLSQVVCELSLSGFEFMIGFPGSIGGEVYMNASAHSQAISDNLTSAVVFDKQNKKVFELSKEELNFEYRQSICKEKDYVVLSAKFELFEENKENIKKRMDENLEFRRSHQPSLKLPNCGSVFKNPKNDSAGRILDCVGAKEFFYGGAKVWENHANFIINSNDSTSEDILNLMKMMYNEVDKKFGVKLSPEVIYIGNKSKKEDEIWKILNQK